MEVLLQSHQTILNQPSLPNCNLATHPQEDTKEKHEKRKAEVQKKEKPRTRSGGKDKLNFGSAGEESKTPEPAKAKLRPNKSDGWKGHSDENNGLGIDEFQNKRYSWGSEPLERLDSRSGGALEDSSSGAWDDFDLSFRRAVICKICGAEHTHLLCPLRSESSSGGGFDRHCRACGLQGHWARECPNLLPRPREDEKPDWEWELVYTGRDLRQFDDTGGSVARDDVNWRDKGRDKKEKEHKKKDKDRSSLELIPRRGSHEKRKDEKKEERKDRSRSPREDRIVVNDLEERVGERKRRLSHDGRRLSHDTNGNLIDDMKGIY